MSLNHLPQCSCSQCELIAITESEKLSHLQHTENSRREFIRNAGKLGLGIGLGATLFPQAVAASALQSSDGSLKAASFDKSQAIKSGLAQRITLLHTADIHGQLLTHDEFFMEEGKKVFKKRGGFATLKSMINELRSKNPTNTLVIDGGDCFQGSGVASLSKGQAIVPLMNNIGYDIMLPGNWEVVYGKEMMIKDMNAYTGAKVCANMFHKTNDERNGELIFAPYFIKNIGGLRIGFIGYNDPLTPKRQSPAYSVGIHFDVPELNVAKYIRILKEQEKCDMVFLLTHMGLAQQVGLANREDVRGVDYILGADTHERVRTPIEAKYTRVTEPGAFGSFVARLEVIVEDGKIKDQNYELLDVDPDKYREDHEMKRLVKKARAPYAKELNRVIGYSTTPLMRYYVLETPIDNLITDALMWKFKPDIALSNGFRFCPPLVLDPKTGKAEITMDYLWNMLPVDSDVKTGKASGKQIREWMEKELHNAFAKDPAKRFGGWVVRFKGMEVRFTIGNENGKRIQSISVNGKPLEADQLYSIIACERDGDPDTTICRMENVKDPQRLSFTLHKVMEEYLGKFSPVAPVIEGRCVATDAPQTLLTQLMGVGYEFR